jgi:hypothetical protein
MNEEAPHGEPLAAPEQAPAPEPVADPGPPQEEPVDRSSRAALERAFETVEKGTGRDERGRFKASETAVESDDDAQSDEVSPEAKPVVAKPLDVPSRLSADAKAAWDKTPEPVRAEVNRAIREMEGGLKEYQERFAPLKPYIEMAEKEGTTVESALQNYVRISTALRQQPDQALAEMFQHAGVNPVEWAAKIVGRPADQQAAQYHQEAQAMRAELAQAQAQLAEYQAEAERREAEAVAREIEQFSAQAPRFDELRPVMARILESGLADDIQSAYEFAAQLKPGSAAPQATPAAAPQPRKAPVQISGAPSSGSSPARKQPVPTSPREALERSFARLGLPT